MPVLTTDARVYEAHPKHPMELIHIEEPFNCDGCKLMGFGSCYKCTQPADSCGSIFHEECALPQEVTSHPFCKGCRFQFCRTDADNKHKPAPEDKKICKACGTHVGGFFYICTNHGKYGHFIHPWCMMLKNRCVIDRVEFLLKSTLKKKCDLCGHQRAFDGMKGWSYFSKHSDRYLHIKCIREMNLGRWKKERLRPNSLAGSSNTFMEIALEPKPPTITPLDDDYTSSRRETLVVHTGKSTTTVKVKQLLKFAASAIASKIFRTPSKPMQIASDVKITLQV